MEIKSGQDRDRAQPGLGSGLDDGVPSYRLVGLTQACAFSSKSHNAVKGTLKRRHAPTKASTIRMISGR